MLFDCVVFKKEEDLYFIFKLEIVVDESFVYIVKVYGVYLVEDYFVYIVNFCLMWNIIIFYFVNELEKCKLCGGVIVIEFIVKLYYYVVFIVND